MKKILALILALCMVFALCACGETSAPEASEAPADESAAPEATGWAPDGPVTLVVAYKAGNGTDNTARILAKYAEKYVGQTIVIENVDGGSGSLGWSQLAEAEPDGMTIGFVNLPNFNSSIVKELGTYTIDDFTAICNHVTETSIVVVRADDDRFATLEDLVNYGKEHDGELKASTNGAQASNHIGAQAFANSAGFKYIDIPQGNTADELLSLRGGESDFCVVKVADIAGMFGCRVLYYSTSGKHDQPGYERVDFDTLLAESDIVSVHAPLDANTEGLMNAGAFAKMKKSAIFLNLGRGPIVVEKDLAEALKSGTIAAAGLDVLSAEPMRADNPLREIKDSDKLMITPHIAWASIEARTRLMKIIEGQIREFFHL